MSKPTPTLAFPEVLDNTILSDYAACPRKCFWQRLLHLQRKYKSIHLHAGKAYAELLAEFRIAFYSPDSPAYHDVIGSAIPAVRAFLTAYGYDEETESSPEWIDSPKTPNRMLECFFAMLDEFPPRTDPIQPAILDGKPAVEMSFTITLDIAHPDTGEPLQFHGRYDMLALYNGFLYVFDDKTAGQLGTQWAKQWDFRSQFTGYALGANTFGYPVVGAIVRGHCIQKTGFKFMQPVVSRKDFQLQGWWDDVHMMVHSMVESYKQAKLAEGEIGTLATRRFFPMSGTFNDTCSKYSGCPMRGLCDTKHPQRWLGDFEINVWDPRNPD